MTHHAESTGVLGRGDLVAALATGNEQILQAVVQQLDFAQKPPKLLAGRVNRQPPEILPTPPRTPPDSKGYPTQIADISLWLPQTYSWREPVDPTEQDSALKTDPAKTYFEWRTTGKAAEQAEIAPWEELGHRLKAGLSEIHRSRRLDVRALVSRMARCEVIQTLPRQHRRRWGTEFVVIADHSVRLTTFQNDAQAIADQLERVLPPRSLRLAAGVNPSAIWWQQKANGLPNASQHTDADQRFSAPSPGTQILILSDLGCLDRGRQLRQHWLAWGRWLTAHGCRLMAIVPCGVRRIPQSLRSVFSIQTWQHNRRAVSDFETRQQLLQKLLVLAAPARRVEPGLLRNLRLLIPGATDAALEADFWNSDALSSDHPVAATLDQSLVKQKLLPQFEAEHPSVREAALNCLREWRLRDRENPEMYFEEILNLSEETQELLPDGDITDARAAVYELKRRHESHDGAVSAFLSRSTARSTDTIYQDRHIGAIWRQLDRELNPLNSTIRPGTDPLELPGGEVTVVPVTVRDREVEFGTGPGHSTLSIQSSNGVFQVFGGEATSKFWRYGCPAFVDRYGTDKFGRWFEFEVEAMDGRIVTQRMRWIPGGKFRMGSPTDEQDRSGNETLHHVTISRGYWMADTACTQDLWTVVIGTNPSNHIGPNLPVDTVSYDDVTQFLATIEKRLPGLELRRPSEAEWEFACRAGTTTAYSFGNQITAEQARFNSSDGTVPVCSFAPNPNGLFEMHGNVWEWCDDWYGDYLNEAIIDPAGPEEGSSRVMRGGSWIFLASKLRSAYRSNWHPSDRSGNLGFRCVSSVDLVQPAEETEVSVAEQDSEATNVGVADKFFEQHDFDIHYQTQIEFGSTTINRVRIVSDHEVHEVIRVSRPVWACDFGTDALGSYAAFELTAAADSGSVRQYLRWVPPGRFTMGSPPNELGRSDDEVAYDVILTDGYWMFETPCTQQLWQKVMADNPSEFVDPLRPVERVSWQEAYDFAMRLGNLVGLKLSLPTEAQWEYACRANTTTAIYTGNLGDTGATAPQLDSIAWYRGNSGHEFDLPEGSDASDWTGTQYKFTTSGTRRVKQKIANPWGLYDMLGNVWEWCLDYYGDYPEFAAVNPRGPKLSSGRVMRGGSWINDASELRSAFRFIWRPSNRHDVSLGFRCVSSVRNQDNTVLPNKGGAPSG